MLSKSFALTLLADTLFPVGRLLFVLVVGLVLGIAALGIADGFFDLDLAFFALSFGLIFFLTRISILSLKSLTASAVVHHLKNLNLKINARKLDVKSRRVHIKVVNSAVSCSVTNTRC